MKTTYSESFIEQALVKVYARGGRTIRSVSEYLKVPRALGGRGQMTALTERCQVIGLVAEAITAGARQDRSCAAISLSERTLQRWLRNQLRSDQRPIRVQTPNNRLSSLERVRLLSIANSAEFWHLPPSQMVPKLADHGQYLASESTFYHVLRAENQLKHRSAERPFTGTTMSIVTVRFSS